MAITNKEKGVWGLDQVYNKINQGSIWEYSTNIYGLWGWGRNNYGQVGYNNAFAPGISSPAQIPGTTWKTLGMDGNNQYQGFATKTDGSLWSWGAGVHGALGHNQGPSALTGLSSPVQIPGTWSDAIFSGTGVSYAVKTDGTLWTWGNGNDGATALNNLTKYSSPVQVGSDTTWGTTRGSLAKKASIKTDGTLWTWGGLEINNNKTKYSSPVQVGSDTTWSTIRSIAYGLAAVKTDGTLWVTGNNGGGKLGQNNQTEYSSPKQIPGTWNDLTGGGSHHTNAFINTDNELWVMGDNEKGYLGQNDVTQRSSPIQIPGSWAQIGMAAYAMMGIKTDGTAWVWGQTNEYGELGLNAGVNYSSPVQLPGTDWDQPQGGMLQMYALKKQ